MFVFSIYSFSFSSDYSTYEKVAVMKPRPKSMSLLNSKHGVWGQNLSHKDETS